MVFHFKNVDGTRKFDCATFDCISTGSMYHAQAPQAPQVPHCSDRRFCLVGNRRRQQRS